MAASRGIAALTAAILLFGLGSVWADRPVVVLTTDYGLTNEAVGLCHGAILEIDSEIVIVDLCHAIRPFDVRQASAVLRRTERFPPGTVFVSVVDPGVGTDRRPLIVETRQHLLYIAPDNGLLTEVIRRQGLLKAWRLDPARVNSKWKPGTFDGRDLFCPAGALLASGKISPEGIGTPLHANDLVRLPTLRASVEDWKNRIKGHFIKSDEPFGNAWTDIRPADLAKLKIGAGARLLLKTPRLELEIPFVTTFGNVPAGKPLAYLNSDEGLSFALNLGNFVRTYGWEEGLEFTISPIGKKSAPTDESGRP